MKNKKVFKTAAILSFAICAIVTIFISIIAKDDIGENAKVVYLTMLIFFPVLFVIFIPVIKVANKKGEERQRKMERYKRLIEEINIAQNNQDVVSFQIELVKLLQHDNMYNTYMRYSETLNEEIYSVLYKNISSGSYNNIYNQEIDIRDEFLAYITALKVWDNTDKKEVVLDFGYKAYAFGGYKFMKQIIKQVNSFVEFYSGGIGRGIVGVIEDTGLALRKQDIDKVWDEIEDWKNNK